MGIETTQTPSGVVVVEVNERYEQQRSPMILTVDLRGKTTRISISSGAV